MRTSEAINEIAAALAKAQGEFVTVEKRKHASARGTSKAGKEYSISYAYADISDVLAAVLPVLAKHGLSVIQPTCLNENGMYINTRLMHASGQWIESDYPVCSIQGDHQKMGGALTYSRRYALSSLVGVAADEDVDGEGAEAPPPRAVSKPQLAASNGKAPVANTDMSAAIRETARNKAREGTKAFNAWYKTLTDRNADEVDTIAEELVEIGQAADQAELARAG